MPTEVTWNFNLNVAVMGEVSKSSELQSALNTLAEDLAQLIRDIAPGDEFPDSIETTELPEADTAAAAVFSASPLAHLIEFGTGMRETQEGASRGEMPPFAPFRRAIESLGGSV